MNPLTLTSTLDLSSLLILQAVLGTVTAVSPRSPSYNLPIALFGLYAVEKTSHEGLRQFGALHGLSLLLDVFWLLSGSRETGGLTTFLLLINMFAKPVTLLAVSSNLKQQGLPTVGPIGVGAGGYGQVSHQGGSTVWSADETPAFQGSSPYHSVDDNEDEEEDIGRASNGKAGTGHVKMDSQSGGGYHTLG